jgi:glycosyltransferase involved in cell wall biosynthesis
VSEEAQPGATPRADQIVAGPSGGSAAARRHSHAWSEASPAVSVVVATRNREAMVAALLDRVERLHPPPGGFEVVVVDDASVDGTWGALCRWLGSTGLPAAALRQPHPGGQGVARTAGLALARGAVVAFTDDDCLPGDEWLVRLTAPLQRVHGPPIAQGRTVPWPDDAEAAGPWARTVWVLRPTWLFETCNVAYRAGALRAAGGFPGPGEAPVGPHGRLVGEDALTGWRVLECTAAGLPDSTGSFVFVPGAVVHHRHHPAGFFDFVAEQRGRGMFPVLVGRSRFGRLALWHGWFLAARTACFQVGLVGTVGAAWSLHRGRRRAAVVAGLAVAPWVRLAWREAGGRAGAPRAVRLLQLAVADAVGWWACWRASVRWRQPVL